MKRRESLETALGVRLVRPHAPNCVYAARETPNYGTFYIDLNQVYRDRSGRSRRGSSRWLTLPCLMGHDCDALAMIRCDKIEEIVENTVKRLQRKSV